jgi:DNA-binding NarL/FixJ family response regulator
MSACPIHGEECRRSARFAELDALIASGWGNAPTRLIDMVRQKNNGVLPDTVPSVYSEDVVSVEQEEHIEDEKPRRTKGVLTQEQIDAIPELLRSMSISSIARHYGVARGTVTYHAREARRRIALEGEQIRLMPRYSMKVVPQEKIQHVIQLYQRNLSSKAIAERVGLTPSTVRGIVYRSKREAA